MEPGSFEVHWVDEFTATLVRGLAISQGISPQEVVMRAIERYVDSEVLARKSDFLAQLEAAVSKHCM
ncbi:MAG: hypothetical protein JWP19_2235 [Rhodoglobus sp.]|nr:hypothetical protein [Rhodoglobus sp.]